MTTLICGSIAYDTLMTNPGSFSDAILPDQLDKINVCFLIPEMKREFGGTGGNIAYNMKLLGDDPAVMATIGMDGGPYMEHFTKLASTPSTSPPLLTVIPPSALRLPM